MNPYSATAWIALLLLKPWFDAPLIAARHYARAYAVGVAASGVKLVAPTLAVNVLPWPEVLRQTTSM